ncbi:hypothetical protein FNW02_19675 [Komarekiella sp. 'clone 1']|uniref:Uncharacterized protein n=1 Tax=Komarekiella delphini-convector SJRDD-AB1 TaxID=2593771 RepID=A0AA40VSA4_9NOST|nr:hypothetical protein [Komarekiella delphini-convector]MBD6617984.1 hypothetical protein [Komarekiella delphini-convector SJRDD-AB1]
MQRSQPCGVGANDEIGASKPTPLTTTARQRGLPYETRSFALAEDRTADVTPVATATLTPRHWLLSNVLVS